MWVWTSHPKNQAKSCWSHASIWHVGSKRHPNIDVNPQELLYYLKMPLNLCPRTGLSHAKVILLSTILLQNGARRPCVSAPQVPMDTSHGWFFGGDHVTITPCIHHAVPPATLLQRESLVSPKLFLSFFFKRQVNVGINYILFHFNFTSLLPFTSILNTSPSPARENEKTQEEDHDPAPL